MTISEQIKTGFKDLPSNLAWVVSRVRTSSDSSTSNGHDKVWETGIRARAKARDLKQTLAEVSPLGGEESVGHRMRRARNEGTVEIKMERAREAAWRAEVAERQALELAREAEALSEEARDVSEQGSLRVREVEEHAKQLVKDRKAEAEAEARRMIEERVRDAREEGDQAVGETREQAEAEAKEAEAEAEEAQARAEEAMEEATRTLAEARELAEEAKQAATAAAEAAQRQAQQLAAEAEEQARSAEEQIAAAEEIRESARETAKEAAREMRSPEVSGDLKSRTKEELLDLAAAIDVEGRTRMTKAELISAIKKSSKESV